MLFPFTEIATSLALLAMTEKAYVMARHEVPRQSGKPLTILSFPISAPPLTVPGFFLPPTTEILWSPYSLRMTQRKTEIALSSA
jgi:hypothetical protein